MKTISVPKRPAGFNYKETVSQIFAHSFFSRFETQDDQISTILIKFVSFKVVFQLDL